MTCGWTGVCHPDFRKVPSSSYQNLHSAHFWLFFASFWITHPCLWKICRQKGPLFREFLPRNPSIWAAHTRTLNMLCTPPPRDLPAKRLIQYWFSPSEQVRKNHALPQDFAAMRKKDTFLFQEVHRRRNRGRALGTSTPKILQ